MVSLQDIDTALARAEQLARVDMTRQERQALLTCLRNARGMLCELGHDATAALDRMTDTLERLSDVTQGR
jgi:hypothetical protein